jgi:formylglycine-generating enzyme required for sulfatase activity
LPEQARAGRTMFSSISIVRGALPPTNAGYTRSKMRRPAAKRCCSLYRKIGSHQNGALIMAFDVFISYPHQNKAIAEAVCAKLEAERIRCWIAPRDIAPSADWATSIVDAIDGCRVMVLIFSADANRSKQVHREVQQALDGEKPLVPFRVENVPPEKALRYYLSTVHWLDAWTPPLEQHFQKLCAAVQALVAGGYERNIETDQIERKKERKTAVAQAQARRRPRADGERRRRETEAEQRRIAEVEAERRADEERRRPPGAISVGVCVPGSREVGFFLPGAGKIEWFKDLAVGPEMVVVPAGSFIMGSPQSEEGRREDEGPQHKVTFAKPFAVGRFAVTFDEWDACVVDGGGNGYKPKDEGWSWGRGRRPVINVSWHDAKAYVAWLAKKTGKPYRLLSEAEWEYVARAGTNTPFWWGNSISTDQANYWGKATYGNGVVGKDRQRAVTVNSFEPNPWGLYQVHGNVYEWSEDYYYDDGYSGAPTDGSVWTNGHRSRRVLRGGCWSSSPRGLRSASRGGFTPDVRNSGLGFRVGRTLVTP